MPTNPDPNRRSILLDVPAELLADVDALVARKRAASPDGRISRNRVLCELLRAGLAAQGMPAELREGLGDLAARTAA